MLRLIAGIAVVWVAIAASGCGGGGTTTIIEKTVTSTESGPASNSTQTFLKAVAYERLYVEPSLYPFTVDGSLVGRELVWEGWGSATATGRGKIEERDFSSGEFNDRPTYPGAVVATGLEECGGRAYYTEVVAEVPPDAVYVPEKASQLTTPCRGYHQEQTEVAPQPTASPKSSLFFTPSHNIACDLSPEAIRCDIRNKSWTPPPKPGDCMTDWGNSVSLEPTTAPRILCAGDTLLSGHYRDLPYGEFIFRGELSCLSRKDGLLCVNGIEEGFFLSFQELKLF